METAIVSQALMLVLVCSVVPLAASACIGAIVAFLQAITQIQEQTLGYLVKFGTISLLILCLGGKAFASIERFLVDVFTLIPSLGA